MEDDLQEIVVTAKPLPENKQIDSRDYRIDSILLISSDGTFRDITSMLVEIQLRQDIYLGFMSGEMLVMDGIDLYSDVKFHGNEFIFVNIRQPESKILIKKAFRVYKVGSRDKIQNSSSRYILYLVSDELVVSSTLRISKAYKSMPVSAMAKDIMVNYLKLPEKKVFVDDTSVPFDIIIPSKRPLEALNWLTSRAYTTDGACFFFYENLDGFHFRSIHSIYNDPPALSNAYSLQNKSVEKELKSDKFSIDSFDAKKDFDVLTGVSSGMYTMGLLGLNPIDRSYLTTTYSLGDNPSLYPENPPSSTDPTLLPEGGMAHYLTYLNTEGMHTEDWIKRTMSLAALNNTLIELVIPGNLEVQVGKVIEVIFPYTTTPSDSQDMVDKYKSGKYLVVAVNQKFDMVNMRFQTVCMVARDSQPETYPAADSELPTKIKKLNS